MKHIALLLLLLIPTAIFSQITIDTLNAKATSIKIKKLIQKGDIKSAEELMPKYLEYFDEAQTREDSIELAFGLARMGDRLRKNDFIKKALPFYQKSLPITEAVYGTYSRSTGIIYYNVGICSNLCGYTKEAAQSLEQSTHIFTQVLGENHTIVGSAYSALANAYVDLLQFEKALRYQLKALNIQANKDKSSIKTGRVLNNIGTIYKRMGQLEKANKYFHQAVAIYQKIENKEAQRSMMYTYFNIGETQVQQEIPDSAQYYLGIVKAYNEKKQVQNVDLADIYAAYAELMVSVEKLDAAEKHIYEALNIYHREFGRKHPKLVAAYITLGRVYEAHNELDTALIYYQHALISSMSIFSEVKDVLRNPSVDNELGTESLLLALTKKANIFIKKYEQTDELEWYIHAIEVCKLAISFSDKMRSSLSPAEQIQLSNHMKEIQEIGLFAAYQLSQKVNAEQYKEYVLFFSEKKKAAALSRILMNVEAKDISGIPSYLLQRENEIISERTYYHTEIQKLIADDTNEKALASPYYDSLFYYNQRYEGLVRLYQKNYPKYFQLKHDPKVISSKKLQKSLNEDAILVSYSLHEDFILISTLTKDKFNITKKEIDVETFNLDKTIYSLRKLLQKRNLPQRPYKDNFVYNSKLLYDHLIRPIEADLVGQKRIIFTPEGMLHYLPFEVLLSNDDELDFQKMPYLIRDFDISYHYSMTLYTDFRSIKPYKSEHKLLAVAPVFDYDKEKVYLPSRQYGALHWSGREVDFISNLFPKDFQTTILKRGDAQESTFKQYLKKNYYEVIHLSSHGLADAQNPDLSWIAFYPVNNERKAVNEDLLYASEVYDLHLKTNLLVLSSCESGLGQLAEGEGMISINRGFLYAGALNIVYSIWKVNDRYTYELMSGFYQNMSDGNSYSEALRFSKLSMIERSRTSAVPSKWAGFLLLGQ